MGKKEDNKSFFGILVGIFGIFLLWSSYSIFLETKVLDFLTVVVPFIGGLIVMFFTYKLIVG
ncbi:MAG: hypothetical protein ISS48_02205 [Candidatus Aenigmarchaeota archaeon]|nr:hypothetical protein [Candidatus Aenigmarchaeota archaeon]